MDKEKFKCCICGKVFDGYGNNPYPASADPNDRCCDVCNIQKVIPARLQKFYCTGSDDILGE